MQTFDLALYNLFKEGRIDLEEALRNADSRTNLEAKINFSRALYQARSQIALS